MTIPTMTIPAEIASAIVKLQAKVKAMEKTAKNDHFKNTYAPLDEVMDKALPLLAEQKLALMQWPITVGQEHFLHTVLLHDSGTSMQSDIKLLLTKQDPQGLGSALTYTRRQTVMSILGLSAKDEDDDGNKASNHLPPPTPEQIEQITMICKDLKYPEDQIAKRLMTVKTFDHALVAIDKLNQVISARAREISAMDNARKLDIAAGDASSNDEPPAADDKSTGAIVRRLKALNLKDDATINLFVRANTGKPFLKNCKGDDFEKLSLAIDKVTSGVDKLPDDYYAPRADVSPPEETA